MRNVAPSQTLARRARNLLQIAFILLSIGIFLSMVGLALYAVPLTSDESQSFGLYNFTRGAAFLGGVFLAIVAGALAIRALTWKRDNELAKRTGDVLGAYLGEGYTFIRNISQRNLGYIDALLIGPSGLLVFRILDRPGIYLNENVNWLKAGNNGGWVIARIKPTHEAIDDIKSLRAYLGEYDMKDLPIFGAVVFIPDDPIVKLTLKDPALPATHLSSLYSRLQNNYLAKDRLDAESARAIVKLLYQE